MDLAPVLGPAYNEYILHAARSGGAQRAREAAGAACGSPQATHSPGACQEWCQ